jgi:endonuclease/exonuclease/phosphatase family metal-dependent hydrolase
MRHLPVVALLLALVLVSGCRSDGDTPPEATPAPATIRFATYNTSLFDNEAGGLLRRLDAGDEKAAKIAAVIQHLRPDVLLLNEFDYDEDGAAAERFIADYLGESQHGQRPIQYRYRYFAAVNTGVPSGLDLDGNGRVGGEDRDRGNDAWGYGLHPGQYGMLVLSTFPIDENAVRTFQLLKWSALPGARQPLFPDSGQPYYPAEIWPLLRLSSKSHWDVPIETPAGVIHFLVAHPTPPSFDGPERRNAMRNHDEIRLWADYLDNSPTDAAWLCDDRGRCGGLADDARFVIAGDYNADPADGSSVPGAINQLLEHPRVQRYAAPRSEGALENATDGDRGFAGHDTGAFSRGVQFRVDYVLPSTGLGVVASGVFWPRAGTPGAEWIDASDHHMVWVDVAVGD